MLERTDYSLILSISTLDNIQFIEVIAEVQENCLFATSLIGTTI